MYINVFIGWISLALNLNPTGKTHKTTAKYTKCKRVLLFKSACLHGHIDCIFNIIDEKHVVDNLFLSKTEGKKKDPARLVEKINGQSIDTRPTIQMQWRRRNGKIKITTIDHSHWKRNELLMMQWWLWWSTFTVVVLNYALVISNASIALSKCTYLHTNRTLYWKSMRLWQRCNWVLTLIIIIAAWKHHSLVKMVDVFDWLEIACQRRYIFHHQETS